MKTTRTIKVWFSTYQTLKLTAALSGETLVVLLDRLARAELARLQS
jgi:hypothetical protein